MVTVVVPAAGVPTPGQVGIMSPPSATPLRGEKELNQSGQSEGGGKLTVEATPTDGPRAGSSVRSSEQATGHQQTSSSPMPGQLDGSVAIILERGAGGVWQEVEPRPATRGGLRLKRRPNPVPTPAPQPAPSLKLRDPRAGVISRGEPNRPSPSPSHLYASRDLGRKTYGSLQTDADVTREMTMKVQSLAARAGATRFRERMASMASRRNSRLASVGSSTASSETATGRAGVGIGSGDLTASRSGGLIPAPAGANPSLFIIQAAGRMHLAQCCTCPCSWILRLVWSRECAVRAACAEHHRGHG